jgi:sec-independent protein translocase protein TatA
MGNFGIWEILLLLLVVLLVFGPKRLPEMGRSLGRGMREFKDSVSGLGADEEADADGDGSPANALPAPSGNAVAAVSSEPTETVREPRSEGPAHQAPAP